MGTIVERVDLPAMRIGVVDHMCKTGVIEAKTRTAEIGMWGDANHSVHDLIEQAAV